MPGKISQDKVNEIREANDIVDVISQYLTLNKKGQKYFGLCPFHGEKTPSFSVSPDKQMFYCFGCHKGGDIFTFMMEHEKLPFGEALRVLAQRAGIQLDYDKADDAKYQEKEAMYHAVRFAANFFYVNLISSAEGRTALEYFKQRGIRGETIKTFGLGYSLNRWDGLMRAARTKSVAEKYLAKSGLIIERDKGGFYDRFRGRLMFPILDVSGRPVAFGARRIIDDNSPKYINSPEVIQFYEKRSVLYGLSQARQSIQTEDRALMVEGYMDLISLHQAGIKNVVATSGTALTEEHSRLLSRYTKNVVLLYDGDSAGSRAALRGLDILLENDMSASVVQLPTGEDPDSVIRDRGKSALIEMLKKASPLIEFKVHVLNQDGEPSTSDGKAQAIRSILDSVIKIKDEIKQNVTLRELAEKFFLDERLLQRELDKLKKQQARQPKRESFSPENEDRPAPRPVARRSRTKADKAEELLTKLLIQSNELEAFIFKNLDIEKIRHPVLKQIIAIIQLAHREKKQIDRAKLTNYFEDARISSFIAKALYEPVETIDGEKLSLDCIIQLEKRELMDASKAIQLRIRECETRGDDCIKLRQQWQILRQELMKIEELAETKK